MAQRRIEVLFGAFDRHNFGDLLFPHIARALLPVDTETFCAGLAERDLRTHGGHLVHRLSDLLQRLTKPGAHAAAHNAITLLHAGGEILTCSAWHAAAMLLPEQEAAVTITHLENHPSEQASWVRQQVGTDLAPYVFDRQQWPGVQSVGYAGVGGADLASSPPALLEEVLRKLHGADDVRVRDAQTLNTLAQAGLSARLVPDPAVVVAQLFGEHIREQGDTGEVLHTRQRFNQGYLAVQISTEFTDDATLTQLAHQLDRVALLTGLGLVLFRAGAAPWHDDLPTLKRLVTRLQSPAVVFESLNLWNICALIANARGFCGSSLHGGIVASAFALPHVHVLSPVTPAGTSKLCSYTETWFDDPAAHLASMGQLADKLLATLQAPATTLNQQADRLAQAYREGFGSLRQHLDSSTTDQTGPALTG